MEKIKQKLISGAALAGLALALSGVAHAEDSASPSANKAPTGECHGVNSCKGTGACASKSNSCAGKNSCKGMGWLKLTKKECAEKKGTFKVAKKM